MDNQRRQTAQLGGHALQSRLSVLRLRPADRAWLCNSVCRRLLEHTTRVPATVTIARKRRTPLEHVDVAIVRATPCLNVACCVAREAQARALYHREHRF